MALSKEEAQELLDDESKLKAKIAQLLSAFGQYAFIRNDQKMINILTWTTDEQWLAYARNNLKKKVE
jgi:hypothetical protein